MVANSLHKQSDATRFFRAASKELYSSITRAVIDASPHGVLVVNSEGEVVCVNQRFIDVWRVPSHILNSPDPELVAGVKDNSILYDALNRVKNKEAFLARVQELYDNPELDDHCEIELTDGRILERHSSALRNDEGNDIGRVWFFHDITSIKASQSLLREQAYQDPLTGVSNRRFFFERASQAYSCSKRHATALSIVEMDVDHFKQINDQYGHAAGDKILTVLCETCRRHLRNEDTFGRLGGEEFAILLPDTGINESVNLAERLRSEVAGIKIPYGEITLGITVSLGVASLSATDSCSEDCLSRADKAMYRAKQNGRNRVETEA